MKPIEESLQRSAPARWKRLEPFFLLATPQQTRPAPPEPPITEPPDAGPWDGEPNPPERKKPRWKLWTLWSTVAILASMLLPPCLYVVATPPRTMFMLTDEADGKTVYQYVDIDYVSRYYVAAVLIHEDDTLGTRKGPFDVGLFIDRVEAFIAGEKDPSGSTIPQQLVKNIFLIRGESAPVQAIRKGVEAILSYPFNLILGDKRQLDLYVNYAQFGPSLYGVCAATWYYFNRPPWDGDIDTAALLVGLLPAGEDAVRAPGGGIDTSEIVDIDLLRTIWRAMEVVPESYERIGGWEGITPSVGITEPASAFNPTEHDDSCSVMPESVAERLEAEGAWWSEAYQ
ncbi:transglycosylase domain-containing protein [Rhodococcus sp. HS-D2]|uniref:transglycosylase domain-containing protein n=1 Tax=Rhodococcus sp. HS-D2 TaxID=1384636 RepID=UPI000AA388AC|nr:transglycosylase domain-containing protein [Rhodococcus sp. HS-D2]